MACVQKLWVPISTGTCSGRLPEKVSNWGFGVPISSLLHQNIFSNFGLSCTIKYEGFTFRSITECPLSSLKHPSQGEQG